MTMSQHVLRVCQNCYFQLRLIRRLGKALSVESKLILLVHVLVHSRLDYCNSVLMRLPWSLVQQLQSVLNYSAARLIFVLKRFDHNTLVSDGFALAPIPTAHYIQLCMIIKCLRGFASAYLADHCTSTSLVPGRSALRSAAHGDIVVPVIELTGVWDLLRGLAPAVGMFCLLVWGLPLLVSMHLQST